MRKFTFFLALMVAMVTTTMAQNYSLTETRLSSSELNSKTEPTLIAIKNLSKTNNYWFVGNTGAAPYSSAEFSNDAVFVWEPVVEGTAGMYCLKKLDGTYMTSASPATFSAENGSGAIFTTTNPTTTGSGDAYFNGDGDTQYDDQALFVRFVTGGQWINVQNGDAGTPLYNTGTGGWTLHNVYLVEEKEGAVEPEPEPNAPVVITSVDQLSNAKLYTITSSDTGRGGMFAAEGASMLDMCGVTYNQAQDCHSIARDAADPRQQFAFVAYEGKHYLYSVSEKKFVAKNNEVNKLTAEAPYEFVVVEPVDNNKFALMLNGTHYLTASPGWCTNASRNTCLQTTLTNHSTDDGWDDGAWYTITEVGDFDATEALAMLAPATPEPEPVTFEIYALDDYMNPSPLEGTVSKLGYVVFAASDNNAALAEAADAPKVCIFDPATSGAVAEASSIMFGDLLGNGMQLVAVQFDGFATPGTYMVYAPAGAFTVNGQPSEEIISAQFTIPAPTVKVFEVESVTPANGAEVEAINKIEIKFTEDIMLQQNPATWDFYTVNLVDENNNVIELTTSDDANIWSKAVFTPAEPITAAGRYTLDLSQIKLDGGVCEGSYSWTVVAPQPEPEPTTNVAIYHITAKDTKRGALYATAESTHLTHCGATYGNYHNLDVAVNTEDINQQFIFVEYEGKTYLYSLGAQKFASKNGQFVELSTMPKGFATVAESEVEGYSLILFNGENRLNFSGGYTHGVVANYESPDDGNTLLLSEVGTFDVTPVVDAVLAEVEAIAAARATYEAANTAAQALLAEANLVIANNELPLQVTENGAAYYLWCNNPDPSEGPIAQLVDGIVQESNFFHSSWRGGGEEPHYIEIDLGEGNELAAFSFAYTTRFAVANDYPDGIQVLGSNDKETYTEVYNVTNGLPQTGGTLWTSPVVNSETAYRYYRFVVTAERIYWHMSEFDIYSNSITVDEKYEAVVKEIVALKDLCDTHANNSAYDKAAFVAATEAINAAVEAVNEGLVVEPENGIDTSKEYYLYSSYNWGMNKGYLAIGTKSGANYGPAYMANEKLQAFKLTPAADGGYTLSREADMGGMSYTEYIDCTHAYNVGNDAMSGSVLYFELNTNNKYYIKSANGYFKADMIDYGTDGYAYHVFSNGDMTSALEWELIPVEDVVDPEQPAAEPLNYVSHSPATVVESVSEVTITFDREVGSVSSDLSSVKLKLDTNVPARGMSSVINGNSVTIYLNSVVKSSGEYTLEIPADIIKAADGGAFAGTTLTITVDAAPVMTSKATVNVENALSDITVEFDSEIEFATGAEKLQLIVKGTETVAAEFVVGESAIIEGNVLTLTLAEEIAPEATTKYDLAIPADFIVKKGSDKAFAGKTITYTVKVPFGVKNITPVSGSTVESFDKIVVEYNAIVNFYPSALNFKLINTADNSEIALVAEKNDNIVTFTTEVEVSNGTYTLANLNNVVDNSSFLAPSILPEYTITIATPVVELEALELASSEKNPNNNAKKLQGVRLNFNEAVKKYTTEATGDYGYIRDAEGNEVAKLTKVMGANGTATYATPYATPAIEMGGTYTIVVNSGVFLSADGTKEYKGGEFEFVVEATEPYFYPTAEEGFCYNETFESVEDFKEFTITIKYAKEVVLDAEKKVTMTCGENVYEAVVTLEEMNAITKNIKIAFDGEFVEGRYTIDVPAALFTVDGVANDKFAQSTFRYSLPQLEITRDFDTWESYLDQVWYMPKGAMITIANAESVEVDETKVATIAVGETVYNSTLSYYYDNWSNAHYIEYVFDDFYAMGFEFVKGDYTFTLPAGAYTVNGEANEEAVKAYTYGDPIVEEFSVTEILPASGSELESLDAISITFSNGMKPDMLPITCGENTYYFINKQGLYVAVDLMSYEPIVITEPGTYTLDLSELEGLTGEKVFSWTIAEPVVVVDYTPTYTGTVERYDRNVTAVTLGDNRYDLLTPEQNSCYVDATETVTFTVVAGATVKAIVEHKGEWIHHALYIDFDGDGFTSGLEEGSEWKPAGDLVSYAFYNNGGSSDEFGYNSVGTYMFDMDRHMPEMPEFVAPATPGIYRIRFVQDWCSIDPNGDKDGKFGDFMGNGGQIIDVMLEVVVPTAIEGVDAEAEETVIYDLTGRRITEIAKPGIYIVNGVKKYVK